MSRVRRLQIVLGLTFYATAAFGQVITVSPLPANQVANPSSMVSLDLTYSISPVVVITGLGFKLFFDSSQLTFDETLSATIPLHPVALSNVFQGIRDQPDPIEDDTNPFIQFDIQNDVGNEDGDANTDMFLLYGALFGTTPVPGNVLFTVTFGTTASFAGTELNLIYENIPPCCTAGEPTVAQITAPPTPTPSNTPTVSPTPSDTPTPSTTPTPSDTPTPTNTPTASNTPTNTSTPSITPTPSNTLTPSITPSAVVPEIPTLSGRGMALMVLLLLGIAALYLARQRS